MRKRVLLVAGLVTAILLGGAVLLYAVGTPQAPVAVADSAASGAAAGVGALKADAEVPEADPSSPLAIQIPGCTCHSDDPQVVAEHAEYRMNQCFGCHADGVPEMGR